MSFNHTAIQVEGLSKHYFIYTKPEDRLKQFILPRLHRLAFRQQKRYYREFRALDDITFEVKKGEAVGIIGRNGAGKSTLLQLICGTLTPTSGNIKVEGIVAALLELGSGFNSEFTGRENVYLNASVLGLTQEEIDQKFDEIAAFADIGDFMEQPVKTYSSGMMMRLAFAVNTCVDPDVLIVDEALSVGDAPFISKCFKRLRKIIDNGTSILFVSHDISTVRSICSRALWLNHGQAEMWGDAMDVAKAYERFCWQEQGVVLETSPVERIKSEEEKEEKSTSGGGIMDYPSILLDPNPTFEKNRNRSRMGTETVIIKNFLVLNISGETVTTCDFNELLNVYLLMEICESVSSDFVLALRVRDLKGNYVYSVNDLEKIHKIEGTAGDRYLARLSMRLPLHHQDYIISTAIFGFQSGSAYTDGAYDFTRSVIWESIDDAAYITVNQFKFMPLAGPVHVSSNLKFERIQALP